jgi:hypothetical protein
MEAVGAPGLSKSAADGRSPAKSFHFRRCIRAGLLDQRAS